ncbi:MAG TPA: hypothetical protein VFS08_02680 [Gemmatimonadaceae bacterium]|nr:hypothetical protein [Gemmatimonadaceae bacterium]
MSARRWRSVWLVAPLLAATLPVAAGAQGWKDRILGAAKKSADAATRAGSDEARRQMDALVGDAAAELVGDGQFTAILSPWAAADGGGRAEVVRFGGGALIRRTGFGVQLVLCDAREGSRMRTEILLRDPPGARPGTVALAAREYPLGDDAGVSFTNAGATVVRPGDGTIRLLSVSDEVVAGTVRVSFPLVSIPGGSANEPVEFAATFRARQLPMGGSVGACAADARQSSGPAPAAAAPATRTGQRPTAPSPAGRRPAPPPEGGGRPPATGAALPRGP